MLSKETEIGQGLMFLPRKLNDLVKSLQTWLEDLTETGRPDGRNKVSDVLKEFLRCNGISHEKYTTIKEDKRL